MAIDIMFTFMSGTIDILSAFKYLTIDITFTLKSDY